MRTASNTTYDQNRHWTTLVLVLLVLTCIGAGPPSLRSGHSQPLRLTPTQVESLAAISQGPEVEAKAATLVDRPSNTVVWSNQARDVLPMASTTKLMTVLVALETLSPDQVLTVPQEALIGNATMGLKAGDRVSVRALVYGALLPSGNDAAMTLALAKAGSEAAFVLRMNEQAADWGMTDTHFENPHGLDAEGHVSSARDLVILAQNALENPLIAEAVATPQITIEGYPLTNTNDLLRNYDGTYGVKTGTTDEAGQVLIAAASKTDGDALGVVLNSPERFQEVSRLFDFYYDYYRWVDVRLEPNALNQVVSPDGTVYALRIPDRPLFLPRWQAAQLRPMRIVSFDASSQPAGLFQLWLGQEKVLESPIMFEAQYHASKIAVEVE